MQRTVIFNKRTRRLLNAALSIFMTLGLSILPVLSAVLPPATSVGAISNGFTVTVAPATAGAQAAYTIDMVAGENYAAADTLTFTFPSGSIVPAGALTSTTVLADAVTPPTTSKALTSVTGDNAARTVVIILNAAITMGHNIRVQFGFNAGIKNPISTGSVSLTVAANTAGNGADKTGSPFSGSYTLQQVSVASFAAGTTVAGSTTNYTFDFTPRNDIPGNGKIEFIFPTTPDTYGLGGAVAASSPNGTIDGTFSVAAGVCTGTANSSAICISRLNTGTATTPGGTVQLQLTNIRNPRISGGLYPLTSGLTGQFGIKTYDGGGGNRDVNLSAGTTTITAAAITSPNDQKTGGGSLQAGAADTTNRLTVSGTIVNPAPAGGQVVINFPKAANDTQVDFNPGSVVLADIVTKTFNGTDIGAITLVSATNNQIIIQSTAGFNAGATSASLVFEINKVRAPRNMANQTTGTTAGTTTTVGTDWSMYTRSSATNVIDYVNTGFPVLTPTNGVLPLSVGTAGTAGTGTPTINFTASSVVTTGVAATVTFATVQALAMNDKIVVDFPVGFTLTAPTANADVKVNGNNLAAFATDVTLTTITTSPNGTRMTIKSPVAIAANTAVTVVIASTVAAMPGTVRAVNAFNLCTAVAGFTSAAANATQCSASTTNVLDVSPAITATVNSAAFPNTPQANTPGTVTMAAGGAFVPLATEIGVGTTMLVHANNGAGNGIQHGIPTGGSIVVVFPSGFGITALSGTTPTITSDPDTTNIALGAITLSGQAATIPVTTGTTSTNFRLDFRLGSANQIVLPTTAGATGNFAICTRGTGAGTAADCSYSGSGGSNATFTNNIIDQNLSAGTVTVTSGLFQTPTATINSTTGNAVVQTPVNLSTLFKADQGLAINDKIIIDLPVGFTVTAPTANSDVTVNGTNLGAFATDVSVTTITTSPNGTRLVITSPVAVTSGATATVVLTTPVVRLPNVVQAVNTVNVCTAVPAFAVAAATANQCLVGGTNIKDVVNPATPGTNGSTGTPISLTNASAAFPATTTGTINMGTGAGNAVLLDPTSASTTSINNTTLIDLSFNNANNAAGIQHEIPTNGSIVVVFPKNLGPFGLSGVTAAVQAAGNAATLAVGVASQGSNTTDGRQTLIIPVTTQTGATPNAAASRYFRLRLTGVVLPGTAGTAGSVGDTFDVCTRATNATTNGCTSDGAGIASSYANQLIDAATNVGTFVVNPAPLSGTSVTLSNNAAGAVNSLTANFQTANPWPDSGRLVVLLPTGLGSWTLPGAGTTLSASSPTANIGALTVTSSANKLIVQRVGGGTISGTFSVTIANVQNPLSPGLGAAMGNYKLCTGNTTFDTTDCTLGGTTTGAVIDFTAAAGTTLTNSGGLSVVSISQTSVNTGAGANYTFNFTPSQSWPANGRFVAVFPAGYTISSGSPPVATFGSANGGLTVSVTGTTVSVTRTGTGTAIAAATAVSLTLTGGITNPATAGASGSFSLATQQPSGGGYANLDIATITGPTIVVPTSPTINAGVGAGNGLDFAAGVNRSAIGQGVAGRVLTITGTNFVSLPTITTSNAGMTVGTVTFVSATQLTVPLTASATASGTFTVTVTNPNLGAVTSAGSLTINPAPVIGNVAFPNGATDLALGQGATRLLTMGGANFAGGVLVTTNNAGITPGTPTVVTAADLTVSLAASGAASAGAVNVTVTNTDGGTVTLTSAITVNLAPTITSLSVTSRGVSAGAISVTITGTNLAAGLSVASTSPTVATATGHKFVSATSATVMVAPLSVGTTTLVVTNADGGASSGSTFTVNAVPSSTSVSPNQRAAGSVATTVTISGTNFVNTPNTLTVASTNTTVATVGAVTVASATSVTVQVTPLAMGITTFVITNGDGAVLTSSPFAVSAQPNVTSISPNKRALTAVATTVTLTGSGFASGAVVTSTTTATATVGATTFVNDNTLTVTATPVAAGTTTLTVTNPDGGVATSGTFTVNAAPTITNLSVASRGVSAGAITVTITGTNFASDLTVSSTTPSVAMASGHVYVTATSATVVVTPLSVGTTTVVVTNGDGGVAASTNFTVNAVPNSTSVSPNQRGVGSGATTVTISGTNFVNAPSTLTVASTNSSVATAGTVAFVNATSVTVQVTPLAIGATTFVVTNGDGGTFTSSPFMVATAPSTASASPSSRALNAPATTVTVTGNGFASGATVTSTDTGKATVAGVTFVNDNTLTVTATSVAVGVTTLVVTNPDGGVATAVNFTINASPTITILSTSSRGANAAAVTVTITGTNFAGGATIASGTPAFATVGTLTVSLSTSAQALVTPLSAGTTVLTITNTDGGTATANFTVNAAPTIASVGGLSPAARAVNAAATPVTVTGTGFVTGAVISSGTTAVATVGGTTFNGATSLTVTPTPLLAGTTVLMVTNPDGGTATATFTVNPAPTITAINRTTLLLGGGAITVTVTGTGFVTGATVANITPAVATATLTTVVNATTITLQLTPVAKGAATFTINNGDGGVVTTTAFPARVIAADATGDGNVTVTDAMCVLRGAAGFTTPTTDCNAGSLVFDADGSGTVTSTDAMLILRWIMGL